MPAMTTSCSSWRIVGGQFIALDRPRIIGILNVTPDSFSDGGLHADPRAATDAAVRMIDEGAAVIDVGGESTRPGAQRVDADEQVRRTAPVIESILRARPDAVVSIDTTLAAVARTALDAGAAIINDVSAGADDPAILPLAGERGCGLILMHRRLRPEADSYSGRYASPPVYEDVVASVAAFLSERASAAIAAGVDSSAVVVDPASLRPRDTRCSARPAARASSDRRAGLPTRRSA
jgi:dihydropteroate synthase